MGRAGNQPEQKSEQKQHQGNMSWYVVHTKPRDEQRALLNLEQQGYECYLPTRKAERLRRGKIHILEEPLFPRYLFIYLETGMLAKGWGAIRSTRGVSGLVRFGVGEPIKVADKLIVALRIQQDLSDEETQTLFAEGEKVRVTEGAFAGIEAVFQMEDGESRAMVLIELLHKPTQLKIPVEHLQKIA